MVVLIGNETIQERCHIGRVVLFLKRRIGEDG